MENYYSMLYVLLKETYPLVDLSVSAEPMTVRSISLYDGVLEPENVYVVPAIKDFIMPPAGGSYAFVVRETDALGLRFPEDTRAVLIGGCHDAVQALNSLVAMLLKLDQWKLSLYEYQQNNSTPGNMLKQLDDLIPQRLIYDDENSRHIYEFPVYEEKKGEDIKYASDVSASPENPAYASFDQFLASSRYDTVYSLAEHPLVSAERSDVVGNIIISRKLFDDQKLLGKVILRYGEDGEDGTGDLTLMDGYCRRVEMFCERFEKKLIVSSKGSVSGGEDALHTTVYNLLFSKGTQDARNVLGYLSELGWAHFNDYLLCAIVIESESVFVEISGYLCGFFEKILEDCIAVREKGQIILLMNTTAMGQDPTEEIIRYLTRLREEHERFQCYVSFSNHFSDILLTPGYYLQCDYMLKHRKVWRTNDWVFFYRNHSMDFIAAHLTAHFARDYISHPGVLMLYDYDKEHETELASTLYYYMKFHLNASEAAAAIPIHRTTFNKRMEKISSIYPFNFSSVDECLHILLTLKLLFGTSQSPI